MCGIILAPKEDIPNGFICCACDNSVMGPIVKDDLPNLCFICNVPCCDDPIPTKRTTVIRLSRDLFE